MEKISKTSQESLAKNFFKELNTQLLYDLTIPLLSIYHKELKTGTQQVPAHAALFTIAKRWKQPKCPSTGEWISKMW